MSRAFFDRELDTAATYWRIFRRDGVALGFTTHDRDLFFSGLLHRAAPGMLPSAIRRTLDLDDDEADIEGALSHDAIRAEDIAAGRFDGASVEAGIIDWETLEHAALYGGTLAAISQDGAGFAARLRSAKAALDVDPVPRTSPGCRARFCGPGCALPAARFETRHPAQSFDFQANAVRFPVADPARFVNGRLRWLDGPDAGQVTRIIDAVGGALVLETTIRQGLQPGDRATLREGCDRTITTCATRFANAANFQGEPFLPGNDLVTHYPQPR